MCSDRCLTMFFLLIFVYWLQKNSIVANALNSIYINFNKGDNDQKGHLSRS